MFAIEKSFWKGAALACALGGVVGFATAQTSPPTKSQMSSRAGSLSHSTAVKPVIRPMKRAPAFVENKGQWDARARYFCHDGAVDTWVTSEGFVFDYLPGPRSKVAKPIGHAVKLSFINAQPYHVAGTGKVSSVNDYYLGKSKVRGAKGYGAVYAAGVFDKVDMRVSATGAGARWDLLLKPDADPKQIAFRLDGARNISVNRTGDLVYSTSLGEKKLTSLAAYQTIAGKKRPVTVAFQLRSDRSVGFRLGDYDRRSTLVIDPLVYGSYFGSDYGDDELHAVVADTDGAVYMTGATRSDTFPAQNGTHGLLGTQDAFVTRFQGDAYNIDYNAYVGGTGVDSGDFIALSPNHNNVWIAGSTSSTDLPGVNSDPTQVLQQTPGSSYFMEMPVGSTGLLGDPVTSYFGASNYSMVGFKVSPILGNVVIGGLTQGNVPGPNANPLPGAQSVFVLVTDPTGVTPRYNAYLGASNANCFLTLGMQGNNAGNGYWPVPQTGYGMAVNDYKFYDSNNVEYAETQVALTGALYANGITYGDTLQDASLFPSYPKPSDNAGRTLYTNGYLVRGDGSSPADAWVAKYSYTEATDTATRTVDTKGLTEVYAALLGGSQLDYGIDVALDTDKNVYVLAESASFDYPRTRGVIGENDLININVTKIDPLATSLVYSTGLNAANNAWSNGITVDRRGIATITGGVSASPTWPDTVGNPDAPNGETGAGSVMTGGTGVLKSSPTRNGTDTIPTADAWVNVINSTATDLLYGTYIGGSNNDWVFQPYVDETGDIWLSGWTDSYMHYYVPGNGDNPAKPKEVKVYSALPSSHITSLAWKAHPDLPASKDGMNGYEGYENWEYRTPTSISVAHRRDGYVMRFRIGLPSMSAVTLERNTAPGGLGVKVAVNVTLDSAALSGGADVDLTLDGTGAGSFAADSDLNTVTVHIDAGATSPAAADLPYIYTKAVQSNTAIQVKAVYEGTFKVTRLTVIPWLQQLAVTPTSLVGGKSILARITIAEAAPTGGVPVTLTTTPDSPALIVIPTPTITIPAGQTTTSLTLATNGVSKSQTATLTASILDHELAQNVTFTTSTLSSVTFAPSPIARGSVSTGTITLSGKSGSAFVVKIHIDKPDGYVINGVDATTGDVSMTFPANSSTATFTVKTPVLAADPNESPNTSRIFTVTRALQSGYTLSSAQGTLYVDGATLNTLTLSPTTVNGGATSTGKVSIMAPAPAGGVTIYMFCSNGNVAKVSGWKATIPEGSTYATFPITTSVIAKTTTVVMTAALDSTAPTNSKVPRTTASLTVNGVSIASVSISPASVVGGAATATGTVVLSDPAPSTGITVALTSGDSSVTVPASVVVAGSTTATFLVTTSAVDSVKVVNVHAAISGGASADTSITVRPVGVLSVSFSPKTVRGTAQTVCTVTLDAPAAKAGTLTFKVSNSNLLLGLTSQSVAVGQQVIQVRATAARVARNVSTSVTATFNGSSASATVNVTR